MVAAELNVRCGELCKRSLRKRVSTVGTTPPMPSSPPETSRSRIRWLSMAASCSRTSDRLMPLISLNMLAVSDSATLADVAILPALLLLFIIALERNECCDVLERDAAGEEGLLVRSVLLSRSTMLRGEPGCTATENTEPELGKRGRNTGVRGSNSGGTGQSACSCIGMEVVVPGGFVSRTWSGRRIPGASSSAWGICSKLSAVKAVRGVCGALKLSGPAAFAHPLGITGVLCCSNSPSAASLMSLARCSSNMKSR